MFSRNKTRKPSHGDAAGAAPPSIVSRDLRIIGDIISEGDVQVDGVIEGDVNSHSVTVGERALVKGCIRAGYARIKGQVDGEIFARNVSLARTAKVHGDIMHESISIEAGAYLDGRCRRVGEDDGMLAVEGPEDLRALEAPRPDPGSEPLALGDHREKAAGDDSDADADADNGDADNGDAEADDAGTAAKAKPKVRTRRRSRTTRSRASGEKAAADSTAADQDAGDGETRSGSETETV